MDQAKNQEKFEQRKAQLFAFWLIVFIFGLSFIAGLGEYLLNPKIQY